MSEAKPKSNAGLPGLSVVEVTMKWGDRNYRINVESIVKEFYDADYVGVSGKSARYFIELDGDMKPLASVLGKILAAEVKDLDAQTVNLFREIIESLGFTVLDRRKHHIF